MKEWRENQEFRSFGIFPFLAVNKVAKQKEILQKISSEEEKFNRVTKDSELLENMSKEEEKINEFREFKMMLWIKNNYSKFEISVMAEYLYPSLLKKIPPIRFVLENFGKLTEGYQIVWWLFNLTQKVAFSYLDLTKDVSITVTLIILYGGPDTLLESPTAFPSVVIFCLLASIILPLFLCSLQVSLTHFVILKKRIVCDVQILNNIGINF